MERAEGDAFADRSLAGFVNDAGGNELVAAVENAVTDRIDLVNGRDDAVLRMASLWVGIGMSLSTLVPLRSAL